MTFVKDSDVQFITQNDVMWIINFKISQLHKTTGFDPDQCLDLLLKFDFDKKSILESYNENEKFLMENGILPSIIVQDEHEECGICCSDNQLLKLDCGHSACSNCWEFYLTGNIEDGHCLIECIETGCYLLIGKSFISQFLDDVANYESLIINTFVKANNTITKCPDASCKLFAKTNTTEPQTVTCTCGRTFCSSCGQEPHLPATCRQLQLWNKKCELLAPQIDDSSQQWLLEYTKECPSCLMTVEKKGGCAHITCPNKKCRHEFCWLCREDWKTHGQYPCDSPQRDAENARLDARADLSNFITHYSRFEHYQKLYKNKPRIINDALETSDPFLREIIHSYVNARNILINSVVFGFFLCKGKYSDELKKFQSELERSTDRLKNSLIYTLSSPNFKKGKSELVNKCHDIEKCQKDFLEFCAKGKEFEDLDGQSYRDAWKKAHDNRVDFDDFTSGLTVLTFIVFAIYLARGLNLMLPHFESWLPDFIVAVHTSTFMKMAHSKTVDFPISNKVLSHHNILAEIDSAASKLEPLLPISLEQRQLLLLKFNWDIKSLKNSFQEYADMSSFLCENGVSSEVIFIDKAECAICCAPGRLLGLECRHFACESCWNTYIRTKINAGQCLLGCMNFGCNMLFSNEMLGKFQCSSKLKINHRRLIKDSYINNKPNLAWCNKKCGMVVRRSNCDTVTCSCGSTFCFLCRSDAHHPATCRQIRDWGKQHLNTNNSDGMTLSWISLNTRECPRCFIPILKNGGCNHMTCTGCRYDYCHTSAISCTPARQNF